MGCSARRTANRWHNAYKARGGWRHNRHASESSGNHAFDEYREETLRRLEEEQTEFQDFLERLRHAKDKAEFDNFMADRKHRPSGPESAEGPAPA